MVFELCAESLDACVAAMEGGADRIELCRELKVGGLTPPAVLIEQAVALGGPPVHVLLRPHERGFVYTAAELERIVDEIEMARGLGTAGVVLGVLRGDGNVDVERTRELVAQAQPMEVTFHRAFDEVCDLDAGLEDVLAAGCDRLLTSGGAPDVLLGASVLARLVRQAAGRITIAAGGGLRVANAREVARASGASQFHGSLLARENGPESLAERVRVVMRLLREA